MKTSNYLYSNGILGSYLYLPIEELQTPVKKLRRLLTARPKYAELAAIPMYDESREGYFGVPRHYGTLISLVEDLKIETSDGIPAEHVFISSLWDNQLPLFEEFEFAIANGKTGFILKARTASGKTVMLLKFLEHLGRNALIIVPSSGLLTQWREMIIEHTSYTKDDIGHVQANIVNYKDKPITISMIHSACKDKYGKDFRNHFGVLMVDEIHRCGAEYFSNVVSMFTAKYRIGASGTVNRPDGMEVIFNNHLNEITISLGGDREEEIRPRIIVIGYRGAKNFIPKWASGLDRVKKRGVVISAVAKDQVRTNILLSNTVKLALSGRRVLVISDRIDQLAYLYKNTHASHKPGMFISTTSSKNREEILKNSGIIYSCVSEDTECLTLKGWKKYNDLTVGEQIASYDMNIDRICYEPLDKIAVYPYKGNLCHIDRKSANILMTWNHRNVVINPQGEVTIRTTDKLLSHDKILLTAPIDYPENEGFNRPEWAELFGWVISEGHYRRNTGIQYKSVGITQNKGRNADRIEWLLNILGLEFSSHIEGQTVRWLISAKSSEFLLKVAPLKLLNSGLAGLPKDQLAILFNALMAGDGSICKTSGKKSFIQKSKINLDWFSIMALRLGFSQKTSLPNNSGCSAVYLTKKRAVGLCDGKFKINSVPYNGIVWCPVITRTGTWVARRKGSVFITGNTYGMFSTGMDVKDLAGLVFATPQSRIRQTVGRILRLYKGKKRPVIIDTVDNDIAECGRWYRNRIKEYKHSDIKGELIIT